MNNKKRNNLKELGEEQLDQVTGGDAWGDAKSVYLPATHGRHIGKYDSEHYIGQKFYFVLDINPELYFWGTLTRSWEHTSSRMWISTSNRAYDIEVEGVSKSGIKVYSFDHGAEIYVNVGRRLPIVNANELTIFLYENK